MERTHRPGRATGQDLQDPRSGSLLEAIDGLSAAVSLLAELLGSPGSPQGPLPPPPLGGRGRHLRVVSSTGEAESPWDALSVVEGWSLRLTARHLGVTPPTVKRAQLRGLEGLRERLLCCSSQAGPHAESGDGP